MVIIAALVLLAGAPASAQDLGRIGTHGARPSPPQPRVTHHASEVRIAGDVDREVVRRVIMRRQGQLRRCYASTTRDRTTALEGRLVVRFAVVPSGAVADVTITESTLSHPPLERCVVREFGVLRFPAHGSAEPWTVSYPLTFRPAEGAERAGEGTPRRGGQQVPPRPRPSIRQHPRLARYEGRVPRVMVVRVIGGQLGALRHCYESVLREAPALAGRLTMRFTIAQTGAVTDAAVEASELSHPSLDGCLAARVRRIRFEPFAGSGPVVVHYPFTFRPPPE